jgi:heptosyltransferase-2
MKQPLTRILLIRTDRIGDVVLTTPAASVLHDYLPGAFIAFMVKPYTKPLLQQHRCINEILLYQPEGRHRGFRGHLKLAKELRAQNFDAAILFYPRPALAAALWMANIPMRIGMGYRWYSFLLTHRIYEHRKHGRKHELEHNLTLLKPLVPELSSSVRFDFHVSPRVDSWRKTALEELNISQNYIIVHPGNGGSAPNLSVEQYRLVIRRLLEHTGMPVLVTGLPGETPLVQTIINDLDSSRIINAAGRFEMKQLMAVISGASLFLSSSTGPLHIANAFGIPLVGFYCPADPCSPRRWGPYHQQEWVLVPPVKPCAHCKIDNCPHGNCLEKIPETRLTKFITRRLNTL